MLPDETRLGWIGLGAMGNGMGMNLQKHIAAQDLPPLSYWNRTIARGEALKSLGGKPRDSIQELVNSSDIIFTSVSDDSALLSVVDEMLESNTIEGKIIIDTSTVHPNATSAANSKLKAANATFIAAPVFGASPAAAAGTVLFAVAGPKAEVETIYSFLEAMSRKVIRVGEDPKQALLLKTTSNFLMAGIMELVGEAHVLAEKSGLGCDALEELLEANFGPVVYSDSKRMTTGVYANGEPWSGVDLAVKDVTNGIELAEISDCRLAVGELALEHLKTASKWGRENDRSLDSTSMYGVLRQEAGLDFETEVVKSNIKRQAVSG